MADSRQRIIIKVFRKYGHSLGPESLEYVEEILDQTGLGPNEVENAVDWIAKEYNRQDDAQMKVSRDILHRVYETLSNPPDQEDNPSVLPSLEGHLHIIDAFEMPLWNWSQEKSAFERAAAPLTMSGSADSRVHAMRNRLYIIKQTVLRNDHFSPSTLPSKDRENLLTLRSTKQLLGRAGHRFLLFGMLSHSKEGKLCLEDEDGSVELDFSQLDQPSEGLFTEGCFALVEGEYTEEATFVVIAIGHPPCENRQTARSIFGHVDFLGKGATTLLEDNQMEMQVRTELSGSTFFVLSDVWLDNPRTFDGLRRMFSNCVEEGFIPQIIVMCGNFTSHGIAQGSGTDIRKYQENFDALADLIASFTMITRTTHFVFVPGPLDLTVNAALPRRPLLSSLVSRLKTKIPKAHFATNPCRIKFYDQEIVIFREDLMSRMLRNLVGVKPDVQNDDLKRYLVQSLLDQSHLIPLTYSVQPILPDYDHTLRLYPLPTSVVLADRYDRYQMTYEGCHVFNPGSFVANSYGFASYSPAQRESEECVVSFGNDDDSETFVDG